MPSRPRPAAPAPGAPLLRKVAASVLVLAAALGPVALATFGRFEDATADGPTSVLVPPR